MRLATDSRNSFVKSFIVLANTFAPESTNALVASSVVAKWVSRQSRKAGAD